MYSCNYLPSKKIFVILLSSNYKKYNNGGYFNGQNETM